MLHKDLPDGIIVHLLVHYLDLADTVRLDTAISSRDGRRKWNQILSSREDPVIFFAGYKQIGKILFYMGMGMSMGKTTKVPVNLWDPFKLQYLKAECMEWLERKGCGLRYMAVRSDVSPTTVVQVAKNSASSLTFLLLEGLTTFSSAHMSQIALTCPCLKELSIGGPHHVDTLIVEACRITKLTGVYLRQCGDLSAISFNTLAASCPRLSEFIVKCKGEIKIDDDVILNLVKSCPHLTVLEIYGIKDVIGGPAVRAIADYLPNIISFGICLYDYFPIDLSDQDLIYLGEKCSFLANLWIYGCANVTDTAVVRFVTGRSFLNELDLFDFPLLTDKAVVAIANSCPLLTCLSLAYNKNITDVSLSTLSQCCPHINFLDIKECEKITNSSLTMIAKNCTRLEHLEIDGCSAITDELLQVFAEHCHHLKELLLSDCPLLTEEAVENLKRRMPQLKCPSTIRAEYA